VRTVAYSEVLQGSAGLAGSRMEDVSEAEFALYRTFHDKRLQEGWEIHHWPDLCATEQRMFRPLWNATKSAATGYAVGDERYDEATREYFQSLVAINKEAPTVAGVENSAYWAACATQYSALSWLTGVDYAVGDKVQNPANWEYYQCITAHTSGLTLAADAANWGRLTAFDRYISANQVEDDGTVHTPIGDFLRATDVNPKLTTKQVEYPFDLSENGAQFTTLKHAIAWAWIYFRKQRPVLSGDAWDETATYAIGQQVYYLNALGIGNFYTAVATTAANESPESKAASWELVELPYLLRGYLITGGYADWLRSDGQHEKANDLEGVAQHYLELEADKLQRQSGQVGRINWRR
jgi:hypothetical protein